MKRILYCLIYLELIIKGWNNDYFNFDVLHQFIDYIIESIIYTVYVIIIVNDEQFGQPLLNFLEIILFHNSTKNDSKYTTIHFFPILYTKFSQIQVNV